VNNKDTWPGIALRDKKAQNSLDQEKDPGAPQVNKAKDITLLNPSIINMTPPLDICHEPISGSPTQKQLVYPLSMTNLSLVMNTPLPMKRRATPTLWPNRFIK
jgi:hypothetical protein